MEAVLSCMHRISQYADFPSLAYAAYAYMKNIPFNKLVPPPGELIATRPWAVPAWSQEDFWAVPKHFLQAVHTFLSHIPECKESMQALVPVPSMQSLQRRVAPDRHEMFLTSLRIWLAAGRASVNYADLAGWARMASCTPFWQDTEFCKQEFHFIDKGAPEVPNSNTQHKNISVV